MIHPQAFKKTITKFALNYKHIKTFMCIKRARFSHIKKFMLL